MTTLGGIEFQAPAFVVIPIFLAVLVGLAVLTGRGVARWLRRSNAEPRFDETAPILLELPVALGIFIGGVLLIVPELALPGRLQTWVGRGLWVLFVFTCSLVVSRITLSVVTEWAARHPAVRPALGIVRVTTRLLVGVLAILTALGTLGVDIKPILATLGVSSLAVALALQDTLANFFAGLYLLADRPVRAGDFIKIADGEQGFVDAIGWRSSRLRTLGNNIVIVPNQKLSQAILTNFHLPEPHMAITIAVTVPYQADLEKVEGLLMDELVLAVGEVPEMHSGEPPSVRVSSYGDSGVVLACSFQVRDFASQFAAAHEIRKRILARLGGEGVEIPYPQRVVRQAPPLERRRHGRPGDAGESG